MNSEKQIIYDRIVKVAQDGGLTYYSEIAALGGLGHGVS